VGISPKVIFWGRMPPSKRQRKHLANYRSMVVRVGAELLRIVGVEKRRRRSHRKRNRQRLAAHARRLSKASAMPLRVRSTSRFDLENNRLDVTFA
jgi:hypothetical protein